MTEPISPQDNSLAPLPLALSGAVDVRLGVGLGDGGCLGEGAAVVGACVGVRVGACVVGAAVVGCGLGRLVLRGPLLVTDGDGPDVVG